MNTLLGQGAVFFNKSKNTFIYGSLIIFTLVLEEVFQKVVFRCPCHYNLCYGLLFLLGPTMFLFMIGILINKKTWKLFVCRRRPRNTGNDNSKGKGCPLACTLGEILFKALLSPAIWLILSFLQKKFYVCAVYGPVIGKNQGQKATSRSILKCSSEEQQMAFSQMWALGILIASTFFVLISVLIAQCWKGRRNLQLPNKCFYKRIEAKAAAKEFHRMAKEQAQNRGRKAVEVVLGNQSKMHNSEDYLDMISKARSILDYEYSVYYPDLDPVVENQRKTETDDRQDHKLQSPEVVFQESALFETYFAVDGSPDTVHFDSELKVVHESGSRPSSKARDPHAKPSIDIKNQYHFRRSRSYSAQ